MRRTSIEPTVERVDASRRAALKSAVVVAGALAGGTIPPIALGAGRTPRRLFLIDTRFAAAVAAAEPLLRDGDALVPVAADVTDLRRYVGVPERGSIASLAGVTTESIHFCLTGLIGVRGIAATHLQRLDRDLFAWRIALVDDPRSRP